MAHWSENSQPLTIETRRVNDLTAFSCTDKQPRVHLLWFPYGRDYRVANASDAAFRNIQRYAEQLPAEDTLCILTTPPDAALLLPYLETALQFQLWIAVKIAPEANDATSGLPTCQAALLVMTRYKGALRHTKTRIQYTYCPACGKTTKDYGGKKHTYHEYGTLMSDVWRDIPSNPYCDITPIAQRLRELFGLSPYSELEVIDLRACAALSPRGVSSILLETSLAYEWQPTSQSMDARLINADCLAALKEIPDNSIDFCFTDPPYNLQKKYDTWNDGLEIEAYFAWCDTWLAELYRVLKPGRTLCVLNIPLWTVRHFQYLCSVMNYQNWIAWEALGFPVRQIMPAHYALLCFSKGEPRPLPGIVSLEAIEVTYLQPLNELYCVRGSCMSARRKASHNETTDLTDIWSDIHRLKHNSRRVDHPCQLPPQLMRRLYALFTRPEETVLDPFNGSGTSTLVAQQMKRRYIGLELSTPYHELALQRHEQLTRGEDPFGKNDEMPIAKNSRVQRVTKRKYAVSKKTLQLDVRRIARELGRLPTRQEVVERSPYPMEYFEQYFLSWGEVCAAARTTGMSELPPDAGQSTKPVGSLFEDVF